MARQTAVNGKPVNRFENKLGIFWPYSCVKTLEQGQKVRTVLNWFRQQSLETQGLEEVNDNLVNNKGANE